MRRRDWFLLFIGQTILREGHVVEYRESRRSFQRVITETPREQTGLKLTAMNKPKIGFECVYRTQSARFKPGSVCLRLLDGWNGESAALACYGAEGMRRT